MKGADTIACIPHDFVTRCRVIKDIVLNVDSLHVDYTLAPILLSTSRRSNAVLRSRD